MLQNDTEANATSRRAEAFSAVRELVTDFVPSTDNARQLTQMIATVWSDKSQVDKRSVEDIIFESENIIYQVSRSDEVINEH